jgi:L-seryl-tRNA(Ser) seleniumtransferase
VLTNSNPSGVLARDKKHRHEEESPNRLQIISMTIQPGEDLIVGNRLRQILSKARKQSA